MDAQLWGIYHTDREYAHEKGDPLLGVVEAETKAEAEQQARQLGIGDAWAHPLPPKHPRHIDWLSKRQEGKQEPDPQAPVRMPHAEVRPPTAAEISTAIDVLKRLGERINTEAADSLLRLPETRMGDNHAARIGANAIEQTGQIEPVIIKLVDWQRELRELRRQHVSHRF
jgi:hypothetical protein